ncbi:hypothetical protein B0H10DRAFT_1978686 [Mycena sp. CBHHK59/15]|nr:hypothetical protein B0H10DRAFT_1978686 [Mycena sp. CBHHK59/15]
MVCGRVRYIARVQFATRETIYHRALLTIILDTSRNPAPLFCCLGGNYRNETRNVLDNDRFGLESWTCLPHTFLIPQYPKLCPGSGASNGVPCHLRLGEAR